MGMFEDAVKKFEEAFRLSSENRDSKHAVLCSSMLAATHLQLTDFHGVVRWAKKGLDLCSDRGFEWKALEYDRSRAWEILGEFEKSLEGYRRIFAQDPGFRDVQARIARLDLLSAE
jgi:tetratricopeptide (TPR) repeat protein